MFKFTSNNCARDNKEQGRCKSDNNIHNDNRTVTEPSISMLTARLLFLMTVLICSVLTYEYKSESIRSDEDTIETTIKKRRGRPKKVKIETTKLKISTLKRTKKVTEEPWTILPKHLLDPLHMSNFSTKFGFNEYETYFDDVSEIFKN